MEVHLPCSQMLQDLASYHLPLAVSTPRTQEHSYKRHLHKVPVSRLCLGSLDSVLKLRQKQAFCWERDVLLSIHTHSIAMETTAMGGEGTL